MKAKEEEDEAEDDDEDEEEVDDDGLEGVFLPLDCVEDLEDEEADPELGKKAS